MPVRGYYRVKTGKRTGLLITTPSLSGKGCSTTAYWLFIGWWWFLLKWAAIGTWRALRWCWRTAMRAADAITAWVSARLQERGKVLEAKKLKPLVILVLTLLLIGLCGLLNAIFSVTQP